MGSGLPDLSAVVILISNPVASELFLSVFSPSAFSAPSAVKSFRCYRKRYEPTNEQNRLEIDRELLEEERQYFEKKVGRAATKVESLEAHLGVWKERYSLSSER